jgi:hypothetical protein
MGASSCPWKVHEETTVNIGEVSFSHVIAIEPERDSTGQIVELFPASRYDNRRGLPLHAHGQGPFCKFRISLRHPDLGSLDILGIYALVDEIGNVLYIGKCTGRTSTLSRRFNAGYGQISPRNCYKGGQSTNCFVNNRILTFLKEGHSLTLFFHQTGNGISASRLEADLLNTIQKPPWNKSIPARISSGRIAQEPNEKATSMKDNEHQWANLIDQVRDAAIEFYFGPARQRGDKTVTIISGDIHNCLKFSHRHPAVCNALQDKKQVLQQRANVELIGISDKNPSSTTRFTYRLLE